MSAPLLDVQLETDEVNDSSWLALMRLISGKLIPQFPQALAWFSLVPVYPYHRALAEFAPVMVKAVGFFSPRHHTLSFWAVAVRVDSIRTAMVM